jgi:hypothetical protein
MNNCIILISNRKFIKRTLYTVNQLRKIGNYFGDVVIIVGEDLKDLKLNDKNLIIKYFPELNRSEYIKIFKKNPISDGREINKTFQFHKINCFDTYFKKWDICLQIDSGMHVFNDVNYLFKIDIGDQILAHSDSYPEFKRVLCDQFDNKHFKEKYKELNNIYNLNIDYFQTGFMLYKTNIITEFTKVELIELSKKWFFSKTNEQAIFNLYFNVIKNIWKPMHLINMPNFIYDYWERDNNDFFRYTMLKYPKTLKFYMKFNNILNIKFGYTKVLFSLN